MNIKRAIFIIVVVLIAGAYVGGYWPEHRRVTEAEAQARTLQARLTAAEARVRLGDILGQLLRLSDAVAARNYGQAATLSSSYFDRVKDEATRAEQADVKQSLDSVAQSRDQVTTALARTEPAVSVVLREQEIKLRKALGYAVEVSPAGEPPGK